jgi:hypothetical protein
MITLRLAGNDHQLLGPKDVLTVNISPGKTDRVAALVKLSLHGARVCPFKVMCCEAPTRVGVKSDRGGDAV